MDETEPKSRLADLARAVREHGTRQAQIHERVRLHTAEWEALFDAAQASSEPTPSLPTAPDAIAANIGGKPRKKRRVPTVKVPRPLTETEAAAATAVMRHGGNYAAAAKELQRDPKTIRENYARAFKKLVPTGSRSVDTVRMPRDRREKQVDED